MAAPGRTRPLGVAHRGLPAKEKGGMDHGEITRGFGGLDVNKNLEKSLDMTSRRTLGPVDSAIAMNFFITAQRQLLYTIVIFPAWPAL